MYENHIKRALDITFAGFLLIPVTPLCLLLAVAIRTESKGSALFRQQRTGRGGEQFWLYKFRSMTKDNDVHDSSSQNQLTRVGKLLRSTSLDEIPQLINILKGDMSFIGPRPWIPDYYASMNAEQRRRNDVRPGITGIAQVYGRNNLTIHEKINYDLRYVNHIGLREDLKVVLLTLIAVVSREGQEIGKGGIHDELNLLRAQLEQHGTTAPLKPVFYASINQEQPVLAKAASQRVRRRKSANQNPMSRS